MPDFRDFEILTLPGWHNSGADHWQSLWEAALPNVRRVEQLDWDNPVYATWSRVLTAAVAAATKPVILVGHSLGTSLATRWALETGGDGVAAALLVATTDRDRWDGEPGEPQGFGPMLLRPLPFLSMVIASTDDPRCTFERSSNFADAWGSEFINAGASGHLGSAADLGLWPAGLIWLGALATHARKQVA